MTDSLEQVAQEVVACTRCPLHQRRERAVPGEGPSDAKLMFIGEGPGFHEDQSGRPFVGAAGQFLEELLAGIGLSREDVFIANVVKCRPPGNRDPEQQEIDACRGYLDRQIALIDPKVIVTLGRFSMARWFPSARISRIHGQPRKVGKRLIVPMYHPAAALHRGSLRQTVVDDFKKLPEFVRQVEEGWAGDEGAEDDLPPEEPKQLSLF
jgi:uracil-DNA glycosylase family 4